jgi:CheY-like chemotaxis protein
MRILIVDDDYISRTKLKTLLSAYGDCDAVYDGEQAFEFFVRAWDDQAPYHLITMDVDMPGTRGQDVVDRIRKWESEKKCYQQEKDAKILMISAMKDADSVVKSFAKGCENYLIKPITPADLQKAMGELNFQPVKK